MAADVPRLAADPQSLAALRREARSDPAKAARAAGAQFEQVFVKLLMKSLREATPSFDPLTSQTGKMYQEMLDDHWAQSIAARGLGLGAMIERQLLARDKGSAIRPGNAALAPPAAADGLKSALELPSTGKGNEKAQTFVNRMLRPAQEAGRATGLPPAFILGQAALESGWGAREIRHPDGSASHNLFGIKAGSQWKGAAVEVLTTEYQNGHPRKVVERFRAYGSYEEAFADYARLLQGSPRYGGALAAGQSTDRDPARFAQAMARAGYATDPAYAEKLTRVIRQTISVSV